MFGLPMQGIPFRVDGKGQVLISWMSRDQAYWSMSDAHGEKFGPRIATPDRGQEPESFPIALTNRKGEVALVWKQGKRVQWALYTSDGKYAGKRGQGGELPWRDKPTAFVGLDDHFYIVY
jgi:hypothetical protein